MSFSAGRLLTAVGPAADLVCRQPAMAGRRLTRRSAPSALPEWSRCWAWRLPAGPGRARPVDLRTWVELGRNPAILVLLLITTLQMSGQFVVFTFPGPRCCEG